MVEAGSVINREEAISVLFNDELFILDMSIAFLFATI
jgi:hypothetical protein